MQVVVIAGGKGTRIASVNSEIPKAMIPVDGMPVLERQLLMAKRYGITQFLFIVGHLGTHIVDYFGDGSRWGVDINYFHEQQPMGTAGALALLREQLTDDFFVFYGDTVMDIDLDAMLKTHVESHADATLLVHPNDHPYDSDLVELDQQGFIRTIHHKPHAPGLVCRNLVNASLFILSPRLLGCIPHQPKSHIERDVLPAAIAAGMKLRAHVTAEYIKDMGTPDRYEAVCNDVRTGIVARFNHSHPRPAIFLDRDGTINREVNLLCQPEQLQLIEGAAEAIRLINRSGYLAIVVTNQPVIARNLCTIEQLEHIHATLETMLGQQQAYLNAIYYCPHHPDRGYPEERPEYKVDCLCRKPKPGLLLQAASQWNIDLAHSYMIGDSNRDQEAGMAAGCRQAIQIATNQPNALLQAVRQILQNQE